MMAIPKNIATTIPAMAPGDTGGSGPAEGAAVGVGVGGKTIVGAVTVTVTLPTFSSSVLVPDAAANSRTSALKFPDVTASSSVFVR